MTNYVILGTGVAGISAAQSIRAIDKQGIIIFIGNDPHWYYSRPGLAYYLSGEVNEKQLFPFGPGEYKALNAHFWQATASKILPQEQCVILNGGKRLPYDRLLVAVGARAVPLKVPGAGLQGVVKLDHMEDARKIVTQARRARTAVVVGGGITALELAEGLSRRGLKVHLLIRTARYWSSVLDENESRIIQRRIDEENITLHCESELVEIMGKQGRVAGVLTSKGQQIECDMLAYAIGIQPRTQLAWEAGIACDRGILADSYLRTNLPNIFAAGDVAQVYDSLSGRSVIDSLWTSAREQGQVAGLNMTGKRKAYIKQASLNVTRLAGLTTTIIGNVGSGDGRADDQLAIARGDSETWRNIPEAIIAQSGFDVNHLRLMVTGRNIVGAIVMGDQKLSPALQTIIRKRIDISPIREKLLAPNAPIADILAAFWGQVHSLRQNKPLPATSTAPTVRRLTTG
jgi:NADPH-dependent 2,4-dienoyl-CoA reductase/sulfur reductase-like enzyme